MTATTSAPVSALPTVAASHLERASALASRGQRTLLGLVGAPGAGKSTLADVLLHHLGSQAQGVPMDGFHLANRELDRLGRRQRKGAPDTFDSAGFAALLRRLRQQGADSSEVVYAPAFTRDLDEPVAGAIPIFADTPLAICGPAAGRGVVRGRGPGAAHSAAHRPPCAVWPHTAGRRRLGRADRRAQRSAHRRHPPPSPQDIPLGRCGVSSQQQIAA